MNDDQLAKLFNYIQDFRAETNDRLDTTASKKQVVHLINTVDSFAGQIKDQE